MSYAVDGHVCGATQLNWQSMTWTNHIEMPIMFISTLTIVPMQKASLWSKLMICLNISSHTAMFVCPETSV